MSIFKSPKLKRSFPKSIESNLVAQALESIMNNESDHWINLVTGQFYFYCMAQV